MINFIIKVLVLFIPGKSRRKHARRVVKSWYYTRLARGKKSVCCGDFLAFGTVKVNEATSIGDGTCFEGGFVVLGGGKVSIGSHCIFGPNVVLQTQSHEYEGELLPFGNGWRRKPIVIGDDVWIGMNVQILPGTVIGDGSIIQMGSVVHGEIPSCSIAGGNPAKVFSKRDENHYRELKRKGAYLWH